MKLDDLVKRGWSAHESNTDEVADQLEASVDLVLDDDGAAKFMNLVNHCIGDHGGDRSRARRVCEAVVAAIGDAAGKGAFLYLAVARHLDNDTPEADKAEERAGAAEDRTVWVRIALLVAQGNVHGKHWDAATTIYWAAIAVSETLPPGHKGERASAVISNNIASELLDLPERSEDQARLMERAGECARTFWLRAGDWQNDERSDYLLSLVRTALGDPTKGREHAERGLATIAANSERPIDEAFLHLARASACRDSDDAAMHAESIAHAESLGKAFEGPGLRKWFAGELKKAR